MILFHRTDNAEEINATGFRDAEGHYGMARKLRGVWLSNRVLGPADGVVTGKYVMAIEGPSEVDLAHYEVADAEGKGSYREYLVPAEVVNGWTVTSVEEDDWEALPDAFKDLDPRNRSDPH